MKLKLSVEIIANNYEEMLKAIDQVKKDYDLGATTLSETNQEGYEYKGQLTQV